jgi:hypothetical protein
VGLDVVEQRGHRENHVGRASSLPGLVIDLEVELKLLDVKPCTTQNV